MFRVDRAGIAIIGAALTIGTGIMSFDQAAQAVDYRTIVLSNLVSNVSAVMLLKFLILPRTGPIWWVSLAIFSTLAGNLTMTGSIANLIVVELAKKDNVDISFSTYLKVGFPLTVSMVSIALVYFVFSIIFTYSPYEVHGTATSLYYYKNNR